MQMLCRAEGHNPLPFGTPLLARPCALCFCCCWEFWGPIPPGTRRCIRNSTRLPTGTTTPRFRHPRSPTVPTPGSPAPSVPISTSRSGALWMPLRWSRSSRSLFLPGSSLPQNLCLPTSDASREVADLPSESDLRFRTDSRPLPGSQARTRMPRGSPRGFATRSTRLDSPHGTRDRCRVPAPVRSAGRPGIPQHDGGFPSPSFFPE